MVNKARTSAFGAGSISVEKFSTTSSPIDIPRISSIAYSGDDTATNTAGGDTITINGSDFRITKGVARTITTPTAEFIAR